MTDTFNSITQYDDIVDKKYNSSVSGFFSLISAYNFINTNDVNPEQYAKDIDQTINNMKKKDVGGVHEFDSLLKYQSGLGIKNIQTLNSAFTQKSQILQYIDPSLYSFSCSIIFSKNKKFFVLHVRKDGDKTTYHIRDCYLKKQYNFDNTEHVLKRLYNTYKVYNDNYKSIEDYTEAELYELFNNVNNNIRILIIYSSLKDEFKLKLDTKNYFKFKQSKLSYNIDEIVKQFKDKEYKEEDVDDGEAKSLKLSELSNIFKIKLLKEDEITDKDIDDECDEVADAKLERDNELDLLLAMSAQYDDFNE